jgi:hypothetical protein
MKTVICLIFCLFTLQSFAQSDSSKINLDASIGGNATGGNYNSYTSYVKSNLSKTWNSNQLNWSPSFEYSKISNNGNWQLKEKEIYSNFNYVKNVKSFKFYLFNEFEHSYLQKVDLRGSLGIGVGHKIISNNNITIDISEVIQPETMISSFGKLYDNFAIRSSTRLKLKWTKSIFSFNSVSFFQPSLYTVKNGGDVVNFNNNINFRSNTTFDIKVYKLISIGLGNQVTYESYTHSINPSTKPLDYQFSFLLKISK